jgi:RNA polymerase sigma-70 factor (ECF subfamily)
MIDKMKNTTNENLMRRVTAGDKHAFEALVYRHQKSVLNFIFRFLGDQAEAEDLTQEVFLRVWKSAETYKPKAKFTTWLYRIAINLCINKQRALRIRRWFSVSRPHELKQNSGDPFFPVEGAETTTAENHLINSEQSRRILNALNDLPASQRLAIVLKIYDGLSYHEISQLMNRSVSAVDSLLIRAKKNLRKKLAKTNF